MEDIPSQNVAICHLSQCIIVDKSVKKVATIIHMSVDGVFMIKWSPKAPVQNLCKIYLYTFLKLHQNMSNRIKLKVKKFEAFRINKRVLQQYIII